jgi:hypothetical protein
MKERQELHFAKLLLAVAMLAILLSVFILATVVSVINLNRYEWSKWFLFASWVLYFYAVVAGLIIMWMAAKPAPVMPAMPAAEGEGAPAAMPPAMKGGSPSVLYAQIVTFALGTLSLLIFFGFMLIPTLVTSTTGF